MVDTIDDLITGLQTYVVAPLNEFGLGGFVFDAEGESIAQLDTDITDHWAEDNNALNDHIAIKPKIITLRGYVGEVVYTAPGGGTSVLQSAIQNLTVISSYLPQLSAAAQQAQTALANPANSTTTIDSIAGMVPAAANIYGLVQNLLGATGETARQQNAYAYLDACRQQKILMGIQTPWAFLTSMAILGVTMIQSEESKFISDIAVKFKQLRIAATQTAATPLSGTGGIPTPGGVNGAGAYANQCTAQNPIGLVPGVQPPATLPSSLSSITGASSLSPLTGVGNLFQLN